VNRNKHNIIFENALFYFMTAKLVRSNHVVIWQLNSAFNLKAPVKTVSVASSAPVSFFC